MITYARSVLCPGPAERTRSNACARGYKLEEAGLARGLPVRDGLNGVSMSPHMKWGIGGVVVGLILLLIAKFVWKSSFFETRRESWKPGSDAGN